MLWVAGVHTNDLARFLVVALVAALVMARIRGIGSDFEAFSPTKLCLVGMVVSLLFYGIFLLTEPLLSVYVGSHGIDFAIFSQVVDSISRRHAPLTSLISLEWRNFLTHHFVPFLYVPAVLVDLGFSAYASISIVHAVCGIGSGVLFYVFARELNYSSKLSLCFTLLVFVNPTVRHGLFFGVHDEVFSLPFLMFALVAWQKRWASATALALLGAATTKESLAFVGIAMIAMIFIESFRGSRVALLGQSRIKMSRRDLMVLSVTTLLLGAFALSYFFLQPVLFGKAFDHLSKVASIHDLLQHQNVLAKLWFLVFLLIPLLFVPIFTLRDWHLYLPAVPMLGMILISGFSEMWLPMNYYGIVPTFLLAAGSLVAASRSLRIQQLIQSRWCLALALCLAFSWSGKKPVKTILRAINAPLLTEQQLERIPSSAKVIASPAAAIFLFRTEQVTRLAQANNQTPSDFDFVVAKASGDNEVVGQKLFDLADLCHLDDLWRIYCRKR